MRSFEGLEEGVDTATAVEAIEKMTGIAGMAKPYKPNIVAIISDKFGFIRHTNGKFIILAGFTEHMVGM